MAVIAALQGADNLVVDPGGTTSCQLSLSNTGTIVEQFTIMVLGEASEWIKAEPPVVSMFPGAQQVVTLTFAPPRVHSTPSGSVPFAVKVIPSNEPEESVTEEGVVTVGKFSDVGAELVPRVATGRLAGRQKLAVDSRGNVPIPVEVTAVDASDALKFSFRPSKLTAAPGAAHFVRIRIKPRKRKWKGHPEQKPYQVHVNAEGERPLVLDGGLTHKALVPKWLIAAATLAAALVLLWYFVIKPVVHDTAVAASNAQNAALKTAVSQAQNQAAQAQQTANQAAKAAGVKATTTTSTTTTVPKKKTASPTTTSTTAVAVVSTGTTTSTTAPPVTGPADGRIEVIAAPGATGINYVQVPSGTTVQITNLVIQNVSGSAGTARIERGYASGQPAQDLLVENLANLTDQEYTFNTPMEFTHDQRVQLRVDCGGNQTACDVAIYYTGPETEPASSTTTTVP